jgi:hypothetical protein
MNIEEKIAECVQKTHRLRDENPNISMIWWDIKECPYSDMKALEFQNEMYKSARSDNMILQVPTSFHGCMQATIFLYSKQMKIKVITEVEELQNTTNEIKEIDNDRTDQGN